MNRSIPRKACSRTALVRTAPSISLVLMTSNGVVTAAASAPLLHPHSAAWVAPASLPP